MSTDLPRCPEHGSLVRDLVLGLLEGDRAMEAEHVRLSCDHCRTWWMSALSGPRVDEVGNAVADAFRTAPLTRARRQGGWKVVAAAACVAIIGAAGLLRQAPAPTEVAHQAPQTISILDFEEALAVPLDAPATDEPLFASGLEDGTLTNWS